MTELFIRSDTIFTSPLHSPQSKELRKPKQQRQSKINDQVKPRINQKHDYESALQFADFIGLSPINKIKRTTLTNVERFFQTKNLSLNLHDIKCQSLSSKSIIKNDLANRKVNFFDLKQIFEQRNASVKMHKYRQSLQKKSKILQNSFKIKEQRIKSARNSNRNSQSLESWDYLEEQENPEFVKLRVQTAREINRRSKEIKNKNMENDQHIFKVLRQKVVRSKIVQDISKDQIEKPESNHDGFSKKWRSAKKSSHQKCQILIQEIQREVEVDSRKSQNKQATQNLRNKNCMTSEQKKQEQTKYPNEIIRFKINNFKVQNKVEQIQKQKSKQFNNNGTKSKNLQLRFKNQTKRFQFSFK